VCHEWSYCWCSDPCGTRSCWDTGWSSLSLHVSHLINDLIFWGWKSCWMCLSFLSLSQPFSIITLRQRIFRFTL
jgi:hypothetical protein